MDDDFCVLQLCDSDLTNADVFRLKSKAMNGTWSSSSPSLEEVRRFPLVGLLLSAAVVLGACTSASDSIEVAESSVADTVASTTTVAEPSTTTSTTSTTTTTTVPQVEPETRCVTVLKCQFAYLQGVDYSLLKLEFTDFSVADLKDASFVRANLKDTYFIRADLTNVDFTGADLSGANLTGATVTGANFTNAKLKDTVICGVDLEEVTGITSSQLSEVKTFRAKGARYCP